MSYLSEAITEEKDLGVTIDWDLILHIHVSKTVNKASRMIGLVRATFTCIDETIFPRVFTTMVRLHLGYVNVIWYPKFRRDKLEVKTIQRRAIKVIPNFRSLPYRDRLEALAETPIFVLSKEMRRHASDV